MAAADNFLIYDGECPFCSNFVALVRLREIVGDLELIDARDATEELNQARDAGFVIDEGMLLKLDGSYYHGADCMNRIALLTTRSSLMNRLSLLVFRSKSVSRVLYPVLKTGRNATIRLLGVSRLGY